jgi:hypothetical protein
LLLGILDHVGEGTRCGGITAGPHRGGATCSRRGRSGRRTRRGGRGRARAGSGGRGFTGTAARSRRGRPRHRAGSRLRACSRQRGCRGRRSTCRRPGRSSGGGGRGLRGCTGSQQRCAHQRGCSRMKGAPVRVRGCGEDGSLGHGQGVGLEARIRRARTGFQTSQTRRNGRHGPARGAEDQSVCRQAGLRARWHRGAPATARFAASSR